MKSISKDAKDYNKKADDSLFGLLSMYKSFNTYFRLLKCNDNDSLIIQITDNPKNWDKIKEYDKCKVLKRSEIKLLKLSIKYLAPFHLIEQIGYLLGIKIPQNEFNIINRLNDEKYYIIETKTKNINEVLVNLKKIIDMSPEKKYEILEKYIADTKQ